MRKSIEYRILNQIVKNPNITKTDRFLLHNKNFINILIYGLGFILLFYAIFVASEIISVIGLLGFYLIILFILLDKKETAENKIILKRLDKQFKM